MLEASLRREDGEPKRLVFGRAAVFLRDLGYLLKGQNKIEGLP